MDPKQGHGSPFSKTATSSTSAVSTQTGVTGVTYYVTDISGSSDKAGALILVKDGSTVIWQDRISNTCGYTYQFKSPLICTTGNSVSVTVDGTAICNSNISGYFL